MTSEDKVTDLLNVLSYLYFMRRDKPYDLHGGVKIDDAYQSFLRMAKITEMQATKIFNYEGEDDGTNT